MSNLTSSPSQRGDDIVSAPVPGVRLAVRLPGIALLLLAGLVLRLAIAYVLLPGQGLGNDLRLFGTWAQTLADNGPAGFYRNAGFADYTPGYLWVLWILGLVGDAIAAPLGVSPADAIEALLKLPAIFADIALAWVLYRAVGGWRDHRTGLIAAALFLFIPVTWYESALWGQVDSVGALLLVVELVLLVDGWSEPATAMATLAAVMKPQYAIGLVVLAAVLAGRHLLRTGSGPVPHVRGRLAAVDRRLGWWFTVQQGFRRLIACAAVGVVVFFVAILPFDLPSVASPDYSTIPIVGHVAGFMAVISSSASYYNVLTANAFNFWSLVGPTPLSHALSNDYVWTYDTLSVFGLPASTVGMLLFGAVAALVVGALALRNDRTAIVLGFTVLAVAFFALPTRVHERYLFPAFAFGAILAATSVRWRWWYVVLGIANVANLHAILTLPFQGYGTAGVRGLPLGAEMRQDAAIAVVAVTVTALFVALTVAFARTIAWPSFSEGWGRLRTWRPRRVRAVGPATGRTIAPAASAAALEAARPGRRGLGRVDLAVFVVLIVGSFATRVTGLGTPRGMYFDEYWHAGTAMEFLQDWRYGIPHEITEWTHPPLAKYAIAAGIALFGDNEATGAGALNSPVTDAAFEPTYLDPAAKSGTGGDRIFMTTGSWLLVAQDGQMGQAVGIAIPGAVTVAIDTADHRVFVGTTGGDIELIPSAALDAMASSGAAVKPSLVGHMSSPITHLWVAGNGGLIVQANDQLSLVDIATGSVRATLNLPAVASLLPLNVSGHQLAVAAVPSGLVQLDTSTLKAVAAISLTAGATGLDLVDGSPQLQRDRNLLSQPTLYVATGAARLETVTVGIDGTLTDQGGFPMPGPITDVRWDRATNMVHVLGKVRDGTPTVYVVEPRDNSIFADAALPYEPVAWVLDSQPNDPGTDRQRILAFAQTGVMVAVDTGSNAFAWRLPGLVAGALLAGLLYLLAMLLFRRRSVGVIFAILLSIDGLLFQQSRIAMNDVYVALFAVAAFVVLAYMLGSRATGLRALAEGLLLPPLMGLLFGLALASKWPGLYAMAGAALIVLLRSGLGRWLALAGMVALTGVFGFQALADNPADLTFLVLMIGLTVALGVGIVRAGPIARPAPGEGPRWVDPRWRRGVPFVWVMGTMLLLPFAVYVASYIPWALSAAGGAQLYAGWPPGHTGQTFLDLQSAMYKYHNEWRFPHGASSPWWAWPFDLKPIWGYLESFLNGSQATVLGAGNPFLFWLAVPAAGFGMWQAWRRRSAALGFVAICLLALWLPWARIDRVAFNYHFYVAVPFAFLLLAYFLAELWDGASARTWLLARASVTVVLFAPALMWLGAGPLCAAAGVGSANAADAVCAAPLSSIPAWVGPWLVGALVASALIWRLLRPQWLVVGFLGAAGVAFAGLYPALAAWAIPNGLPSTYQGLLPTWDVGFQFASNQEPVALTPILGLGTLAVLVATAAITAVAMLRARPRPEPTGAPGAGTGPGRLRRSLRAILPYSSTTR